MTYELEFSEKAWKEWKKNLGVNLKDQFKRKLRERLVNPRVPADRFSSAAPN
jgi:mRNA interferase RelE/StbE